MTLPGLRAQAYTPERNGCSTKSVVAHEWATRTVGNGLSTAPPPVDIAHPVFCPDLLHVGLVRCREVRDAAPEPIATSHTLENRNAAKQAVLTRSHYEPTTLVNSCLTPPPNSCMKRRNSCSGEE